MKNTWLKIIAACAVCAMSSASTWAQRGTQGDSSRTDSTENGAAIKSDVSGSLSSDEDSQESKGSSRHLSATGRQNSPLRISKVIGSPVKDSSGNQIGQIQDILVSPSGKIDFAVLSFSGAGSTSDNSTGARTGSSYSPTGSTSGKLIPVPWSLLKGSPASESIGSSSEAPSAFTLNVDQNKLSQAPSIDESWSNLNDSSWRQRSYSHFGVSESSAGWADSPSGNSKGAGAQKLQPPTGTPQDNPQ